MKLNKKYSIKEIADLYDCQLAGNHAASFDSVSSLINSKPNSISFLSDSSHMKLLDNTNLSCVITTPELSTNISIPMIITDNPQFIFSKIIRENIDFKEYCFFDASKNTNVIKGDSCLISANVAIGDNVKIGNNVTIYPNTTIYNNCEIGDRVIIHAGSVIGSDGFGLIKQNNVWIKIPHVGNVVIGNDVEIGANTTIDRATIDSTVISDNVKIDNLVHIAHNVQIGKNTAIAACVGIAGSTIIGGNCTIGGGSGINGHIEICDDVHIHGMTMVTKSINKPGMYASGTTVEPVSSWRKNQARFKELDALARNIKNEKNKTGDV
tara:strand:- start:482 stop:1450 length:969 start_codon:yes stop_codon:yes gene_type:complete